MLSNYQLLYLTTHHECTQDNLDGIYSFDHIPEYPSKYPSFWIINNEVEGKTGEHWFGCFFPDKHQASEMFCSFGRDPEYYSSELGDKLKRIGNGKYKYNTVQVQADHSKACAYFVLYYVDLRCRGLTYEQCMNNMSKNDLDLNEQVVTTYVKKHMAV